MISYDDSPSKPLTGADTDAGVDTHCALRELVSVQSCHIILTKLDILKRT